MTSANSYWGNIADAFATLSKGLALTFKHLIKIGKTSDKKARLNIQDSKYFQSQVGVSTIQFPHEQLPIPDNGRYQLHNEIDDCIVCDKCVKVCPVNCITIEPIRSEKEFSKTSDGSPKKIYAAKFDIDMGKCCFCGLCTTVCPTECLTMTPTFDFSTYNMDKHYFKFGNMTEEEAMAKKKEWEEYQKAKQAAEASPSTSSAPTAPKLVFKPKIIMKPTPPKNE
jgi:formate hydrogenlyase subunit 6/NADH:ubiquinone oxidoreductase subunit I